MDFGFTQEQELLRNTVRDFMRRECPPQYVRSCDEQHRFPSELRAKMAAQGWFGTMVPEAYGGSGRGIIDIAIIIEETARWGIGCDFIPTGIFSAEALSKYGSEAQKQKYLPRIARGEVIFGISFTEPEAGTDFAALTTSADARGDELVLNGHKMFTSLINLADVIIVAARTDKTAKKHKGISLLLLDPKAPGVTMREIPKLGGHIIPTYEVWYENVRVPRENLLGELNNGWYQLIATINTERVGISAHNTGSARAALDYAVQYVGQRQQFGQPIGKFQAIQHKLAADYLEVEAARLLTYSAAWYLSQGDSVETHMQCALAKLKSSEIYKQVTLDGMQVMGGYGYCMEFPMQRWLREAVLQTVDLGNTEVMLSTIAFLMGMPR
ncbi:MAG: acyl-CoA/acyl-ACP dehydrogenase [Deltaproteobacteria bacterium]|nr:acyl-CoA/acyl-ACP dehydrogenase [Deltaproteobacteria bacterium]